MYRTRNSLTDTDTWVFSKGKKNKETKTRTYSNFAWFTDGKEEQKWLYDQQQALATEQVQTGTAPDAYGDSRPLTAAQMARLKASLAPASKVPLPILPAGYVLVFSEMGTSIGTINSVEHRYTKQSHANYDDM